MEREIAALHLAAVDQLTGLRNRRSFESSASKILEVCLGRNLPATLLGIDLDGFKAINDTEGHEAGDRALVEFAKVLCATFRTSDVIARSGGDEFAVLLPGTGADDARDVVGRLRTRLDEARSTGSRLAASVGLATATADAPRSLDELQRAADAAMYEEKTAGGPQGAYG